MLYNSTKHFAINIVDDINDVNDHDDDGADSWCDLDLAGAGAIVA